MIKNIINLGDQAVYCDFGHEVNEKTNMNVISYFNHLRKLVKDKKIDGIDNLIPSYNKLIINFDLNITNFKKIKKKVEDLKIFKIKDNSQKTIRIPICFDEKYGLDLVQLSKKLKISKDQIIETHLNKEYFCYMTGFIAGMPFIGDINKNIRVNRLKTPRVKVPKGSVGITEQFCNIYTFESPGGWNIIGNTPINIFDSNKEKSPNLINPGDLVVFKKITKDQYLNYNE